MHLTEELEIIFPMLILEVKSYRDLFYMRSSCFYSIIFDSPVPLLRRGGPYPVPKPYAPTIGARDVAGDAPTLPEFW